MFLDAGLQATPESEVRNPTPRALRILDKPSNVAAGMLGNGSEINAADTVPFCLWAAARHLDSYEDALWDTVAALGDRDTTCAIVGGIVAARVGREAIPQEWRSRREVLPPWVHEIEAEGGL